MNNLAIIGGGAAGLMAAVTAAEAGAAVTLFEQNGEPGKKILASGNGHCNIINTYSAAADYAGEHPAFGEYALKEMDFIRFERFCKKIGLLLDVRDDGKCYPLSNEAKAVQSAMVRAAEHRGVRFVNDHPVTDITQRPGGFDVITQQTGHGFDTLILCTGSPAAPQLGGNESGLHLAEKFGHTVLPFYPSLVGLHLDHPALAKMRGVKSTAKVALLIDSVPAAEVKGDILFTRYGISGFAVLDLSQQASKALSGYASVVIALDLLPDFNPQSLAAQLEQMAAQLPDDTLHDLLGGLIPHKLIRPLLQGAKISDTMPCRDLNAKTAKKVVYAIKNWRFHVTETHGFQHAEVAGGGVNTEEIDDRTMASKLVPGLYFAGELIDIVGRRGGFNFHFAWASGYLAGRSAAER